MKKIFFCAIIRAKKEVRNLFNTGDYVVYCSGEICLVAERSERSFGGAEKTEYCKLIPIDAVNSAYYVPAENMAVKSRRIMTKEEILTVIDGIPQIRNVWYSDKKERKSCFDAILKSDDISGIIGMMKSIYEERKKRTENGKKLIASDEKALSAAEHMLHREFAFVLGIKESDVGGFISGRLENI